MTGGPRTPVLRTFRAGDGEQLAEAWTRSAPLDPLSYSRFRDLFMLDRNFDRDGLFVAEVDGRIAGAAYAVRRRVAHDGSDLEPTSGWLPFLFVRPEHRHLGLGASLLEAATTWLASKGIRTVYFSSYTPNYFLPGLDAQRYPEALRLMTGAGFRKQYDSVAMHRDLDDYQIPQQVLDKVEDLRGKGFRFGSPNGDQLVELLEVAATFNSDWSRAIREAVLAGLPLDRIVTAAGPDGGTLGWAMHGTYEGVIERFGPFGVLPTSRGTGLGEILLHLTLERMKASGTHSAWFLWTEETSAAGHLYLKTGFHITRTFTVLEFDLDDAPRTAERTMS